MVRTDRRNFGSSDVVVILFLVKILDSSPLTGAVFGAHSRDDYAQVTNPHLNEVLSLQVDEVVQNKFPQRGTSIQP